MPSLYRAQLWPGGALRRSAHNIVVVELPNESGRLTWVIRGQIMA